MLSGDNGILQKATTAKENTDSSQIQERINLAYHSSLVDGQGKVTESSLENEIKKEFNKTKLDEGWLDKASKAGKWIITIDNVSLEIPAGKDAKIFKSYSIGDEISIGNEEFYVLESSNSTQDTVTVLAKYNLNKEGTAQAKNAKSSETSAYFSSNIYWESTYSTYTNWDKKKLDINEVSGEVLGDAIYKAKQYATTKGGTKGRLITYEEVSALYINYEDMIMGKSNKQGENSNECYLWYYTSSIIQGCDFGIWWVCGSIDWPLQNTSYDNAEWGQGVRPVMTISKSLISEN